MAIDDHDFVVLDDDDIGDYNSEGLLPQSPETIQKIEEWLQPTDFAADSSEYKKHLSSYVAGTGNWIQETETYQDWHKSSRSASLWIKAIPGAGKSVFAAMIADKLSQTEKVPVLYFFFRQIITKNHDPQYLVRDWLCQLLPYSPSLQSVLRRHMEERQSLDEISTDEFWHILLRGMESIPKIYCVADALDEMDISKLSFLNHLVELGNQVHSTVKVLMTSRPLPRIESVLRTPSILQISILQIRLRQNMVDTDIAIYVNHRLREYSDVRLTKEIRETVRNAICTKGQGSFLYARLMMDNFFQGASQMSSNSADIEQLMRKLPASLEDMYNEMLIDHATRSGVPRELQLTILQWVTHSIRPLRLLELAAMIDSVDSTQRKSKDTKALVRTACGPLLEILEDETVSIIHHSFTEFLIDQGREERISADTEMGQFPVIKTEETHRLLALKCLRYLTSGVLDGWELSSALRLQYNQRVDPTRLKDAKLAHSFLDYAASNLCAHVSKTGSADETIFAALDEFMRKDSHAFTSWLELTWPVLPVQDVSPLHVVAYNGIVNYCQHLIQLRQDVNGLDASLRTPISWASTKGHANIVAILLENGANADPDDKSGLKPLHYAAMANQFEVVRLLLVAGVNPLTPRTKDRPGRRSCCNSVSAIGHTALKYACEGECTESVIEFMKYISVEELDRALGCAASAGKANVVIALLGSPHISVDNLAWGATPLCSAARMHNPLMIKALLEKGANPNGRSIPPHRRGATRPLGYSPEEHQDLGETPLHYLARGYHYRAYSTLDNEDVLRECCKLLVDAGSDVDAIGDDERHPIHYSTSPAITSILLEHGAKATATSKNGSTPLHITCEEGAHEKLMDLLIRNGADINAKRHVDGKSPLHLMLRNPNPMVLESFLAYKPDVNAKDDDGDTPLHLAIQQCYSITSNTIQPLLDAGADPNQKNIHLESPIHMFRPGMICEIMSVIPVLLKAGADLEARDNLGRTVLLRCVNDIKAVRQLLDLGANVSAIDIYGNSALHSMCQGHYGRSIDLLRLLVKAGANVTRVNHEGNTILHESCKIASSMDRVETIQFLEALLELGVPANQKNYSGATPLHITCSFKPDSRSDNSWKAIIDLLLGPKFRIGIDEGDNNSIRAIHFASTISEQLVFWLVDAGADILVRTLEGQTPLQVACRARQTNIVGMLLEIYAKRNQSHLIDWKDQRGRTALHDACRSGRPETVRLLLEAGADPNTKDEKGYTPLHVCAEFVEENVIWSSRYTLQDEIKGTTAANVLIGDSNRPVGQIPFRPRQIISMWDCDIQSEHDTVRIREILRLLVAHGADLVALSQLNCTPLYTALCAGCEVMVDELLPVTQKAIDENKVQFPHGTRLNDAFAMQYLRLRSQHTPRVLEDMVKEGQESFEWNKLLRLDDERLFNELIKCRVDFFNQRTKREAFPSTLVTWGYASLLGKFGHEISIYHDLSRRKESLNSPARQYQPLLHKACRRELPNMDIIRILVDEFGVNVNDRTITEDDSKQEECALHILAGGQHWWQIQAIEYLLQRGADIEVENEQGETPLSICVDHRMHRAGCWCNAVADVLLRYGANPNSIDRRGLTCLNKAGSNNEMVRRLIEHGADVNLGNTPALFSAIANYDLATIGVILDSGAGLNSRRKTKSPQLNRIPISEIPPLHFAASFAINIKPRWESALSVIKIFLEKGADPFQIINGDTTVIHDLLANGGILDPFLELPGLEIERRDPSGRTLLLASCNLPCPPAPHFDYLGRKEDTELLVAPVLYEMGADITARDNRGLNVLHCILLACQRDSKKYKKAFLEFLNDAPFLIHQKDHDGNTPIHYALRMQRIWFIESLLSAGSSPIEPDSDGNTALHYLAQPVNFDPGSYNAQQLQLFKKFLTLGVSINTKNTLGETPLFNYIASWPDRFHWARGIREDVIIFQEAGADFLARNNDKEGLLHIAAKNPYTPNTPYAAQIRKSLVDRFKHLIELGCDPLAEDVNQRTALDVAAACGNEDILKIFKRDGES